MSNLGSLGSSPLFLSWLQSLQANSLEEALEKVEGLASTSLEEAAEDHAAPAKIKDEEILALAPPPPTVNFASFQTISSNFGNHFGIDRAALDKAFGVTESAITLAAATAWADAQRNESDLVKEIVAAQEKNPLVATLSQYIAQAPMVGLDALALQQMFRQTPVVSTLFHGVDPDLALKAYQLAEQQIVLNMLDKWVEAEGIRAQKQREHMKVEDIRSQEITHQMLNDYIKSSELNKEALAQPALSILVSAIVMGVTIPAAVQSMSGVISTVGSTSLIDNALTQNILDQIQDPLKTELRALTSGLIATATAWATPVAMTIVMKSQGIDSKNMQELNRESLRAFIITFTTFLTNPHVDALFLSRLEKAFLNSGASKEHLRALLASLKASLLINLLAILYKNETGGMSLQELQLILSTPVTVDDTSLMSLLTKLIREEIRSMKDNDPKVMEKFLSDTYARYETSDSTTSFDLESIIEPIRSFISLWDSDLIRQQPLIQKG